MGQKKAKNHHVRFGLKEPSRASGSLFQGEESLARK